MAAISIGTLTDLEKTSYVREGLEIARPNLIYQQFGQGDRVEKREGKTRQWFRMTKPGLTSHASSFSSAQYVKNTTGAPPTWTPATPADTTISAQVDFLFGQGHEWNEGVEYTSFADLPKELRILNAQHAAEAIETEVIGVVKAGTTVAYANAKANRNLLDGNDKVDMDDILTQVTTLRNNDAKDIKGMFRALVAANVIEQLMKDSAFRTAIQFQKDYLFSGTIAELYGVAFQFSSLAPKVADSGSNNAVANVEQTIIVGANSYGITKWMLNDYNIVYTKPGGWGDEWAVKHAMTWYYMFKSVILNQNWLLRLESSR
ncbi:N4-gp56 family major capsid protein [Candidatus Collierbacteria bacterium]|nr:N4-gp56 family major capsid protein [Candidatus Collierbacteria bacterium]